MSPEAKDAGVDAWFAGKPAAPDLRHDRAAILGADGRPEPRPPPSVTRGTRGWPAKLATRESYRPSTVTKAGRPEPPPGRCSPPGQRSGRPTGRPTARPS